MSCFEHISFEAGENDELISLSVAASVQCCIVMSGTGEPVRIVFISQRPALRTGSSTAPAPEAGSAASTPAAKTKPTSCRIMLRTPG